MPAGRRSKVVRPWKDDIFLALVSFGSRGRGGPSDSSTRLLRGTEMQREACATLWREELVGHHFPGDHRPPAILQPPPRVQCGGFLSLTRHLELKGGSIVVAVGAVSLG